MRFTAKLFLILWAGMLSAAEPAKLTIYTYSSFTADWGPGPAIKTAFEEECGCVLEFVALDDGVSLLSRIRLEGKDSKADVVLGLDTNLTAEARATGLFAEHGQPTDGLSVPGGWEDSMFLPFDYGYFAFVYDHSAYQNPPTSLRGLVGGPAEEKIIIQDPRTSTPGLGLLLWVRKIYGDRATDAWAQLSPRILTVTKSWSEAYGLFLKGEAPLVLSYTTSPAYHLIAEDEAKYAAAPFEEGHYLQVEVAAKLASSKQSELADRFLAFMLSDGFQQHIPTGNWMYPAKAPADGLPKGYETLITPEPTLSFSPEEVLANRKAWVKEWLDALSR